MGMCMGSGGGHHAPAGNPAQYVANVGGNGMAIQMDHAVFVRTDAGHVGEAHDAWPGPVAQAGVDCVSTPGVGNCIAVRILYSDGHTSGVYFAHWSIKSYAVIGRTNTHANQLKQQLEKAGLQASHQLMVTSMMAGGYETYGPYVQGHLWLIPPVGGSIDVICEVVNGRMWTTHKSGQWGTVEGRGKQAIGGATFHGTF
jgi:hypothetical protein